MNKRGHSKSGKPHLFDDISESSTPPPSYHQPQQHVYNPTSYVNQTPAAAAAATYHGAPSQQPPTYITGDFSQPNFFGAQQFVPNTMMNDMAMQYGQAMLGQGSNYVQENITKYVSSSRIRYYFAVDNAYVGKKLLLLLFPYSQRNWSLQYQAASEGDSSSCVPVAPRADVNAPDLYIPCMAFLTYVLLCGVALGIHDRFTPERLGVQTSTALVWLLIEICVLLFTLYIFNLNTRLRYLDLVAYSGYKYVQMILIVASWLFFGNTGFYVSLIWCSLALAFFLVRTLHFQIHSADQSTVGTKRRHYLLIVIAAVQPVFMWLLTTRLQS